MPPKKNAPKQSTPIAVPPPDDDLAEDDTPLRDSGVKLVAELIAESDINIPPEEIEQNVNDFSLFSDQSDWTGIAPHFIALSSLSRRASTFENWDTRFRAYRYIISCFGTLVESVQDHCQTYANASTEDRQCNVELANAVTMIVILAQRLTVQIQLYVSKTVASANAGKRGKARNADLDSDIVDWKENQRGRMLKYLLDLLDMQVVTPSGHQHKALPYVYAPESMEADLISRFMDTVTQLLEDPENAARTNQAWLTELFCIWRTLSLEYGKGTQIANCLFTNTFELPYLETATTFPFIEPLVALMNQDARTVQGQHRGLRTVLEMIVRRACSLYSGERADRPPPKAFCMMIQALAIHCSDIMLQEIYSVFKLLENSHMNVRMATLHAIADLYCSTHLNVEFCDRYPGRRKKRLDIFLKVCRHINDEGTNVRSKAVSLLRNFMETQKIPEEFQSMGVISVVGSRLNDKSVQVRKAAIQFLSVFLDFNAYGHDFSRALHVDLLETKRADMRRLASSQSRTMQDAHDYFRTRSFQLRRDIMSELGTILRNEDPIKSDDNKLDLSTLLGDLDAIKVGAKLTRFYLAQPTYELHETNRSLFNLTVDQMLEVGTKKLLSKVSDDYEDYRVQMLHQDNADLMEDQQAAADRQQQANQLKAQVLQLINKMSIEVELAECLKLALRCVSMGETAEIKEAIKFLSRCKQFGIDGADNAIRSMCSLVWRPTADVIQELVEAAEDMFISRMEGGDEKAGARHKSTVDNLMSVMQGVTEKDRPSVEEVIFLLSADELDRAKTAGRERRKIDVQVIAMLWAIALDNCVKNEDRKITALRVLYAISRSETGLIEARSRLRLLQKKLSDEPRIAVEALRIISILGNTTSQDDKPDSYTRPIFRIHQDDSLFKSIEALFFREVVKADDSDASRDWFGIIRLTIHTFLNVSMDVNVMLPKLAAHFLYRAKKISEFFLFYSKQVEDATNATRREAAEVRRDYWSLTWCRVMEKLMAFCGEVAVQLHAYIQVTVPRLHARYYTKMTEAAKNDSKVREEPVRLISDLEKSIAQKKTIFSIPQDLSPANASNDLYHTVSIMCDKRLFVPAKLLGRLLPIVVYGMRANSMPARIRYAAQVAFGKYMPLSAEISAFAAPSFFSVMVNSTDSIIRCNMIASCCDFAFSQPTLFELYAPILFRMSQDKSAFARESTVLVLSHLMANDMIQTRGVLSEPARCICDPVRVVREAAQSFFRDLNVRSDTVTQLLPEFLYRLACSSERLPMKSYKTVFEFLITLLKEKAKSSADAMIDRVCMKFSNLDMNDTEGPKYLLIALAKFVQNDGALHRLQDNWRYWSKFLCHPSVAREYRLMIDHMQSTSKSEEFKSQCAELINNIDKIQAEGLRKEDIAPAPSTVKRGRGRKAAASSDTPGTSAAPTPSRTTRRKRAKSPVHEESEGSDGGEPSDMDQD